MVKLKVRFPYGMRPAMDRKDVPDGCSFFQQNFVNSPLNAITIRPGYFKKNTTVLDGAVMGVYGLKTRGSLFYIAADSTGQINTV